MFRAISLMVVHNLNLYCIGIDPAEADAPLVVDPYTVLPRPIAMECLQSITRNCRQIRQHSCCLNLVECPFRHPGDTLKLATELTPKDFFGFLVTEEPNHN